MGGGGEYSLNHTALIIGVLLGIVLILFLCVLFLLARLRKERESYKGNEVVTADSNWEVNQSADMKYEQVAFTPPARDEMFMNELYRLMDRELANSEFGVQQMAEMMHVSRTKLYYKVKDLAGENPSVLLKRYRLKRAFELLSEGKFNISETADMTGFSTLSHFSISFKKEFGVNPSEYIK